MACGEKNIEAFLQPLASYRLITRHCGTCSGDNALLKTGGAKPRGGTHASSQ